MYQENQYQPVFEEYPEVVVNGVSFIDVRIEDIDPDSLFRCDIAFDLWETGQNGDKGKVSMDSPVWKILGFFLAAVLLFLVPVMNMLERQESAAYTTVFTETNRFADSARIGLYHPEHVQ